MEGGPWSAHLRPGKGTVVTLMPLVLPILLLMVLLGALPIWGHSRGWGYVPSAIMGLLTAAVVVLLYFGVI
jgi:hypothetical protein